MANRYWVGGGGNWSDNTNHWSASSGGSPGASLPSSSDDVYIDMNSGLGAGGQITVNAEAECHDFSSSTGNSLIIDGGGHGFYIYGSFLGESTLNMDQASVIFSSTTTETVDPNGTSFYFVAFSSDGGGGDWTLNSDLNANNEIVVDNGVLRANGYNLTARDFYLYSGTGSTPTLYMGSGTWETTGSGFETWFVDENDGQLVTINAQTSTIKINNDNSSAKTFAGGGKTYNNLWYTGSGGGNLVITGSNTFSDFTDDSNVAHSVLFANSSTNTFSTFNVSGFPSNLITLDRVSSGQFTLSMASGESNCGYLDINNSVATGGASWYAGLYSVDGGNNSGWDFSIYSFVSKPATTSYTNVNPSGKTQYDQSNITYDDSSMFYDGINPNQWTDVSKPSSTTWTDIAKPTQP